MSKQPVHSPAKDHLKDIALLFSVPIGIIVILITFLYAPRLFAHPAYNFIYCEGYYCDDKISVTRDGKIEITSHENERYSYGRDAKLYFFDVERDSSRPIPADEATSYKLDTASKSPDGYALKRSSSSGSFLFWGSYGNGGWTINKGIISKPINLSNGDITNFIGWVLP